MTYEFKVEQFVVSTTPVKILDGFLAPEGATVSIRSTGNAIGIGGSSVTKATGWDPSNEPSAYQLTAYEPADLYAVTASGTATVTVFFHVAEEV